MMMSFKDSNLLSIIFGLTLCVCLSLGSQRDSERGRQSSAAFPPPSTGRQCSEVGVQFVQERIGSASLVPEKAVHDSEMEICYHGDKDRNRKSCCTRKMERKFHDAAGKDFYEVVRSTSSYLKNLLTTHANKYQDEYVKLIESAQNSTEKVLADVYQIPARYRYAPLEGLFTDLLAYVRRREVSIRESVTMFFDELFPLVFHYQLEDSKKTEMGEDYRECLMEIRQKLVPKPFGDIPRQVAQQLTRALQFPRTFVEALNLGVETINTTDHVTLDTQCTRALTRLRYCGSCDDHVGSRPCRNFCYNVMRGCLATVTEIDRHWNEYVDAIKALTTHHIRHDVNDAETVLGDLHRRISEAILHAMENGHKFYPKVVQHCGHPETSKSTGDSSSAPASLPSRKADKPLHVTTSRADTDDSPGTKERLHGDLDTFMRSLLASKEFYANLADTMCSADKFATGFDQDQCWNGTHLGRYNRTLVAANLESQMDGNPEMKVGQSQQKTMIVLIDKLMHIKKLLSSKIAQDSLQGDDWNVKYQVNQGYGSGMNKEGFENSDNPHMDDEDYGGSGGGRYYQGTYGSGDDGGGDGRQDRYRYDQGSGGDGYTYYTGTRVTPERRPGAGSDSGDFYLNNEDEDRNAQNSNSLDSNNLEQVKDGNSASALHIQLVTMVIAVSMTTTWSASLWLNG